MLSRKTFPEWVCSLTVKETCVVYTWLTENNKHAHGQWALSFTHLLVKIHSDTHILTQVHTYRNTHKQTHTHTHSHTQTQTLTWGLGSIFNVEPVLKGFDPKKLLPFTESKKLDLLSRYLNLNVAKKPVFHS